MVVGFGAKWKAGIIPRFEHGACDEMDCCDSGVGDLAMQISRDTSHNVRACLQHASASCSSHLGVPFMVSLVQLSREESHQLRPSLRNM